MRIREGNRNMILLATLVLCCLVIAGTVALFQFTQALMRDNKIADNRPVQVVDQSPVRVVGAPFVPNVNPRER
jgi:hypothetical protein